MKINKEKKDTKPKHSIVSKGNRYQPLQGKQECGGNLLSDCCGANFDVFGFPRGDGFYDEKCLKCGKLCDVSWQEEKDTEKCKECGKIRISNPCCYCGNVKGKQPPSPLQEWWEKDFDSKFEDNEVDGFVDNPTSEIKAFISKKLLKQKEDMGKKISSILFDLYQSHDCSKDTACEFEDRLEEASNKILKIL